MCQHCLFTYWWEDKRENTIKVFDLRSEIQRKNKCSENNSEIETWLAVEDFSVVDQSAVAKKSHQVSLDNRCLCIVEISWNLAEDFVAIYFFHS